jgi:hypothetical protein
MTMDQLATFEALHMIKREDIADLVRLAKALATLRGHIDSGLLFEGYNGREPQAQEAARAIDELEAAARNLEALLAHLCAHVNAHAQIL